MRNFGSIVASIVVIGTWMASPAGAVEITLDAGPIIKWITAAAPGGNPTIPLAPGDVLVIRQSDPNSTHGFVFDDASSLSDLSFWCNFHASSAPFSA